MKATLSTALALTTLLAVGGQAVAAVDADEGYQRGFYGKRAEADGAAGKAAFGSGSAKIAFAGPQGGTRVLTSNGVQAWEQGSTEHVASSGGASSVDGHEAYRRGIAGKL